MKPLKTLALAIISGASLFYCELPKESSTSNTTSMLDTMNTRPVIYQMLTRLFGNTNTTNRPWGTMEENGVGRFADITPKALEAIRDLGVTHVWYTGVLEHAVLTDYTAFGIPLDDADVVKGRAGSPYSIKDYYDVNPDLAVSVPDRMTEFEHLVERTHQAGLKVIIDFVPNHVARSYGSDVKPAGVQDFGSQDDQSAAFKPSNNFYYIPGKAFKVPQGYNSLGDNPFPTKDGKFDESPAKATGNDVFSAEPSVYDWFEAAKLNYGVDYLDSRKVHFDPIPDTWLKMRDILLFWAGKKIDGFRCDMAEMVPVEFWQWVTKEVRDKHPDFLFIAEIYNPHAYRDYIFTGGFDYLYDKVEMYDTLKHIIQNSASTDDLPAIWQRQEGIGSYMLRFLENHDEQRIASPFFAGDMKKGIPMMAASAFMHTGPVMLYFGQDVGEPGAGFSGFSGDDGRTTHFDYWGVPEHVKWVNEGAFDGGRLSEEQKSLQKTYQNILQACNDYEAFKFGAFYDLHYFNRSDEYTGYSNKVYAFLRHSANQAVLVVVSFSETEELASIRIPTDAWERIGLAVDNVTIGRKGGTGADEARSDELSTASEGYEILMEPLSYAIFEIRSK